MLRLIISITVGLAVLAGGAGASEKVKDAAEIDVRLQHYVQTQEALAADDSAAAGRSLVLLSKHVEEPLRQQVQQAAKSKDLATMRQTFIKISDAMETKDLPADYSLAFCPMANSHKGAYWIQKKGKIANPYYGSSMLRCGAFKEARSVPQTHHHKAQEAK